MLTISIHKDQDLSRSKSDTALDGSTVADVLRMAVNKCTGGLCNLCRVINRAVVNNNDFEIGIELLYSCYNDADALTLIVCGNEY